MTQSSIDYNYMPSFVFYAGAAIGFTTSALSIFGSSTILFLILRYQRYTNSVFQRLMLGLSLSDLVASISILLAPFAMPAETGAHVAVGNEVTCQIASLSSMYSYVSFFYSAEISLYFLLMIRYGWSERQAQRRLSCWMLVLPWVLPTYTQCMAIYHKVHRKDPLLGVCVIDCSIDDDDDSNCPEIYSFVMTPTTAATFIAAVIGIVCIFLVFRTVYRQESASNRHSVGDLKQSRAVAQQALWYLLAGLNPVILMIVFEIGRVFLGDASTLGDRPQFAALALFVYLFFPLQGFLNWIIYCRPSYTRWRKLCPDKSRWWAYQQVLAGRPPLRTSLMAAKAKQRQTATHDTAQGGRSESLHQPADETSITNGFTTVPEQQEPVPGDEDELSLDLDDIAEAKDSFALSMPSSVEESPTTRDDSAGLLMERSLQIIMGWSEEQLPAARPAVPEQRRLHRSYASQRTPEFRRQLRAGTWRSAIDMGSRRHTPPNAVDLCL